MPIYEYRCSSCGHQQEFLQKVSDPPHTVCPQCGKPTFSKMVTAAGFQLKGSGWYVTDFRNSGKSSTAAKSTESKPSESKAEKSGGKPASDAASATKPKPTASSGDSN